MLLRISLLLALTTSLAFAYSEEKVIEQVDTTSGGNLVVDVGFGTILVDPGASDKVAIEARRKIDMHDEAREKQFLEEAPITIHKDGNTVTLRARRADKRGWSWHGSVTMDAEYVVHVPKSFNLDLNTGGGMVSAGDITGQVKVSTSGGKLKLTKLHGPIDAKTSGGG